jgi:hypothetical protein
MKTRSRMLLRSLNLGSDPHRRLVNEYQAGAVRLGGAEEASNALKKGYCALAVVLALSSSLVHALSPTCAAPGCNSVTSDGSGNTAMGSLALVSASVNPSNVNLPSGATLNTASGSNALQSNTTGSYNTALGGGALNSNVTGNDNTASGVYALAANTTGGNNTAIGFSALGTSTTGDNNTATGFQALESDSTGFNNTAMGSDALRLNSNGNGNTAVGFQALLSNQIGNDNTASGLAALYSNALGNYNVASGHVALYSNTNGSGNEASGHAALFFNTTGSYNVAIGYAAGYNQTTGSNNIYISHRGVTAESGVTRIGTANTQTETYIAGIENAKITGAAVYVTSSGQLGVLASSERYKTDITPMGTTTENLQRLRPVSFHLKSDPKGAVQYGLIAEEVAKVYPELVIRDDKGRIDGVRYDELAPMLLNELRQQKQKLAAQNQRAASQDAKISQLQEQLTEMHAALLKLESKDQLVARR